MFCSRNMAPPGHQHARAGLRQQGADDVQRVGQHLQVQALEVRAHLQRRRAAIDHDAFAGLAQGGGGAADGPLLRRCAARCSRGTARPAGPVSDTGWPYPASTWRAPPCTRTSRPSPARRSRSRRNVAGEASISRFEVAECNEAPVAPAAAGFPARARLACGARRAWSLCMTVILDDAGAAPDRAALARLARRASRLPDTRRWDRSRRRPPARAFASIGDTSVR